jgi:hypothetical protein
MAGLGDGKVPAGDGDHGLPGFVLEGRVRRGQAVGELGPQVGDVAAVTEQLGEPLAFVGERRGALLSFPLEDPSQVGGHPHLMLDGAGHRWQDLVLQQGGHAVEQLLGGRAVLHGG